MPNDYFDWPSRSSAERFVRYATVASEEANDALDDVSAGFAMLPDPDILWGGLFNYVAAGGSVNAWTATIAATYLTALVQGLQVRVNFAAANTTTTPTLNLNGLGAKVITRDDASAVAAGDIPADATVTPTYDTSGSGTWRINPTGSASATAAAASAAAAAASASAASTSATAAAASAAAAASYAGGFSGTSATSVSIGTGARNFTTQTGKLWVVGQPIRVANTASPESNWMDGVVTGYNSGTGVLDVGVTVTNGAGTLAAWTISISGARGATGATGADGMSINSTQRGTITIAGAAGSNTAVITAVNTAKTQLRLLGMRSNAGAGADPQDYSAHLVLTNGTTITATRTGTGAVDLIVSWELTEFT